MFTHGFFPALAAWGKGWSRLARIDLWMDRQDNYDTSSIKLGKQAFVINY
jgi:hypothetical protein